MVVPPAQSGLPGLGLAVLATQPVMGIVINVSTGLVTL